MITDQLNSKDYQNKERKVKNANSLRKNTKLAKHFKNRTSGAC
jgi:hypothetical protein